MEEVKDFPVPNRFMAAVYFTVAIWTWWWHGDGWQLKLSFSRILK